MNALLIVFAAIELMSPAPDAQIALLPEAQRALPVATWEGKAFSSWAPNAHVKDVSVTESGLAATVVDRDSQFFFALPKPIAPSFAYDSIEIDMRVTGSGEGQVFWVPVGEKGAVRERAHTFIINGDGTWQTYRFRPTWYGAPIDRLRLDFPKEFACGVKVEVRRFAVLKELGKADAIIDADRYGFVSFRLKMPPGFHHLSMLWRSETKNGWFGFSPASDGEEHAYAFNLRDYVNQVIGGGGFSTFQKGVWKGKVPGMLFQRLKTGEDLPVKDVRFTETMPELPPDPVLMSVHPYEAIPRAGRPFPVEIVVRNYGTQSAKNLRFAFDSLPAGVRVLDEAALAPVEPLPGAEGSDTIQYKRKPIFKSQHVYRLRLSDFGVGTHTFGVTLTADGVSARRRVLTVEVKPSLGLAKADYVPEPKKIDTSPYEIGAFIFPGWGKLEKFPHCCWHTDWSYAPWRKPVLGWYDENEPETMDWQIKQMAENGISYVCVDWYWSGGKLRAGQWAERFPKAKWRKYLKWQVNWCNESSPVHGLSRHTLKDHEIITRYWIDHYFKDPQYRTVNGMPAVMVFLVKNIASCCEKGVKPRDYFDLSRKMAREAGYKGIWFETTIGDNEDQQTLDFVRSSGIDAVGQYGYWGRGVKGVPLARDGSRSYPDVAATSYGHWSRVLAGLKGDVTLIPSLSTGWDNMPWNGEIGWRMTNINAKDFRKICADAKRFADETGVRRFCMGALDEWGEGEIGYPNAEHGYGFFEAIRDTFGKKPVEGWPVNCAPEDVGRNCPDRLEWECEK